MKSISANKEDKAHAVRNLPTYRSMLKQIDAILEKI
jgi:hypothetical protein